MNEFYNGIVKNLKREANILNEKLQKHRDNHDMNGYIATIKSLREILDLIKRYDWQLMYSEYRVDQIDKKYLEETLDKINDEIELYTAIGDSQKLTECYKFKKEIKKQLRENKIIEIAIWEQNHDGEIKNHKKWKTNITCKDENNLTINASSLTINGKTIIDSKGIYTDSMKNKNNK